MLQNGTVPINWTQFTPNTTSLTYYGIVAGPDKNMWFIDAGDALLVKMTMAGATTTFSLNGFAAYAMALGADHRFYLVADNSKKIDAVTTAGSISSYTIPSGDSTLEGGIAAGPDGNVWFVEQRHIGKVTPAGVITEYAYTDGNAANQYHAIAAGNDGNLWFTEYNPSSNKQYIGKIVPATGTMTLFQVTGTSCHVLGIASGNGNYLWFTCPQSPAGNLGKITTSGVFTTYPEVWEDQPSVSENTIKGPDGNPWWISSQQDIIAEYDSANNDVIGYLPPYGSDTPTSLAVGPDGNIWVTTRNHHINVYITKVLAVSPALLTFAGLGQTQTLTVSETGNPTLTASSSNPAVASVGPGHGSGLYDVKSLGAGRCTVTFSDAIGNSFNVPVTVSNLGVIREYPTTTANSGPVWTALGSDGNMWFGEFNPNSIGRITQSGSVTEFPVSTAGGHPNRSVLGPDHNVWFSENAGGRNSSLGRITPGGTITLFPGPRPFAPYGVAAGPDGNIWFTEPGLNGVGNMTIAGTFTIYPLPANSGPRGIESGPDGNLWFAEYGSNHIGRITTTGSETEFVVPTPGGGPYSIATGTDGNLWFTEFQGNKIGKITPSGTFTEYPVASCVAPVDIMSATDGKLYFTCQVSHQIGRITTAGVVTFFSIPSPKGDVVGIRLGGDGHIWFVENTNSEIGVFRFH